MASSDAAAANTRMRYMTTNAGVRTASPGEYCRTAGTLLRRLRFTRLSMAHSLGSISGGHQPGGGSRKRTPQTRDDEEDADTHGVRRSPPGFRV